MLRCLFPFSRKRILISVGAIAIVSSLSGCEGFKTPPTNAYVPADSDVSLAMPVVMEDGETEFIFAGVDTGAGQAIRISLDTHPHTPGSRTPRLALPSVEDGRRFIKNPGPGASPDLVYRLAKHVASRTVCISGTVTANTRHRSVRNPADLNAILAANGGQILGGTVPSGVRGSPLARVEYRFRAWRGNLWCS